MYRNYIYAAIAGLVDVKVEESPDSVEQTASSKHRSISVIHNVRVGLNRVPTVGVIVTCKVLSINSLQAKCQICCIEDNVLKLPFKATLRKEDIAADNKDIIEVYKCFRPRDMILARVIGLSDQGYMLTTGEDELGVVVAFSEASKLGFDKHLLLRKWKIRFRSKFILHEFGISHPNRSNHILSRQTGKIMIPISWNEMICPETYIKEERKIAKVLTGDILGSTDQSKPPSQSTKST